MIYAGVNADSGNRGVWRIQLDDVVVLEAPAEASNAESRPLRVLVNPATGEATFDASGTSIGAGDRLLVLDAAGRIVSTVEGSNERGAFRWDGRDASGHMTPAGTYFAVLDRGGKRSAEKFVWLGR
jgi:YD repeat-containing protein